MKVRQLVSCLCTAGLGQAFIQPAVPVVGPGAAPCRNRPRTSSWPVWAVKDSSGPADLKFSKYHGIGNDFILVDNRGSSEPVLSPEQSQQLCDRNFGIGGDGVIFALPGKDGTDYSMRIYNSDGSEPEMCGNGIRCLAKFLLEVEGNEGQDDRTFNIWTLGGVMRPVVRTDGLVTVDMGAPILEGPKVPTTLPPTDDGRVIEAPLEVAGKTWKVTAVSMGNPHAVVFVDDVAALDLHGVGPQFEKHLVFPKKTNTEFVQVMGPQLLKMRVWERGAGPTLACGTGACALVVAANLARKIDSRTCTVQLPGGDLEIEWRESDGRVYMTGPADLVFSGQIASP